MQQRPPHVTVFGDSVAEGVVDYAPAKTILTDGFNDLFEIAACRRIADLSCPFNGVRPPNVIDVVNQLGSAIGPNVVIAGGYNDYADHFAKTVNDAVTAMENAGVKRIFWLTLHVGHADYQSMNDALLMAAANHKSLIPVDWNTYAQAHPEWFQSDGIHLLEPGSIGMATYIHTALARVLLTTPAKARRPLRMLTTHLPDARKGKPYGIKLAVTGGRQPYFWTLPHKLPRGLRLRPSGWLGGAALAHPGTYAVVLRVRDAAGTTVTRRFSLRIHR